MKKIHDIITKRLDDKKKELKDAQERFSVMCHNEMQSQCFEINAIHDLIIMQQLKSEIVELKHCEMVIRNDAVGG